MKNEEVNHFWDVLQKPRTMDILLAVAEGEKKYTQIYNYLVVVDRLITMTTLKHRLDELKEVGLLNTKVYDAQRNYVKYAVTPLGLFVAERLKSFYKNVEDRIKAKNL